MVTLVLDGQAGSSGKGKVIGYMAGHDTRHRLLAIDNFMTNAGHTFVYDDGRKIISQHIPTSMVNPHTSLYIGPGAAISLEILSNEIRQYHDVLGCRMIYIHPRAMVITEEHKEKEKQIIKSGSTFKGCGAASADKIMRVPGIRLMLDCMDMIPEDVSKFVYVMDEYAFLGDICTNAGAREPNVIVEGSQGFDLDINWGLDYPHVTSRQCNASQLMADCGLSPRMDPDIIMVIRPYPIRINNQSETGEHFTGNYSGSKEISWDDVKRRCGAPSSIEFGEMTTVTKRMRRVFEFNRKRFMAACMVNEPNWIALNFAQYIDWEAYGVRQWERLPNRVLKFIDELERMSGIRVGMVGTGPADSDMCLSAEFVNRHQYIDPLMKVR